MMTKTAEVLFHWKDRINDIVYLDRDCRYRKRDHRTGRDRRADLQQIPILQGMRTELLENAADELQKRRFRELQKQIRDIELREQALSEVLRAKSC